MFLLELSRVVQADREREIREHVRVRNLVRAASEHARGNVVDVANRSATWSGRRAPQPDGAAR
jgi:hypothetical protein